MRKLLDFSFTVYRDSGAVLDTLNPKNGKLHRVPICFRKGDICRIIIAKPTVHSSLRHRRESQPIKRKRART